MGIMSLRNTDSETENKNVTFRAPESLIDDFEESIWNEKVAENIEREANRSDVLRLLMESFCENGAEILDSD